MPERRLSFLLVSFIFTLALGTYIVTAAFARTIGQPEQAKDLLHKSGLYEAIIPSTLADQQQNNPLLANVPLDNPEIQKLLATSLDSKKVQEEGDKAVDGLYSWLEGKRDKPTIAINIMPNQQSLAQTAGDYAAKYAATLPACAPGQGDPTAFSADPLSATCLPAGTTPEIVKQYISGGIANNPALGVNTQLTEEDVKFTNGKTIMEAFDTAPVWYQRAQTVPMWAALAALVCVVLLLLILKPVGGLRSSGKHMLSVGITLAAVAWLLAWILTKGEEWIYKPFPDNNANVGDALMKLTTLFNNALRDNIVLLSLVMAGIGAVLFALAWLLRAMQDPVRSTPASGASLSGSSNKVIAIPAAAPVKPAGKPKTTSSKKPAAKSKKKK